MAIREWQQLTTVDFQHLDPDETLVLLPLGATEQHGAHLPVGTDDMLANAVLQHTLKLVTDLELLVLPSLWCTKSNEHMEFPGTLSLQTETMTAVIQDMAYSIAKTGLKKLVLLNWHGGNTDLLANVARDVRLEFNLLVALVDGLRLAATVTPDAAGEAASFGLHAGRGETSIMLATFPGSVKQEALERRDQEEPPGLSELRQLLERVGDGVTIGWMASDLSRDGVVGDPQGAGEEEGQRYLQLIGEKIAGALRLIAAFDHPSEIL